MHPIFHLGTLSIPAFGICILAGTVCGFILLRLIRKFTDLTEENSLDAVIWAIILGFVGAKLLYFVTDPPAMPTSFSEFFSLLTTGLVFYGGLIGGIAAIWLVSLRSKKSFFTFTDLLAPCFCLAHAGGRVGCIMAGCCYGMESSGVCSMVYPDGVSRLAVPLMEAIFLVVLAAVLVLLLVKQKRRATVTGWYLILYAVWRFIIEFFRGDEVRGFVGKTLSTSQFISIFILLAGIAILYFNRKNLIKRGEEEEETEQVSDEETEEADESTVEETQNDASEPTVEETQEDDDADASVSEEDFPVQQDAEPEEKPED